MANRMIVMNGGVAEQIGSPLEGCETQQAFLAAQFIDRPSMNTVDGKMEQGSVVLENSELFEPGAHQTGSSSIGETSVEVSLGGVFERFLNNRNAPNVPAQPVSV